LRAFRPEHLRPQGGSNDDAVANFKGVAKTTSAVTLAGTFVRARYCWWIWIRRVSNATLFGVLPDAEVDAEHSMLLFSGEQEDLGYAIRPTYWPGIDLVCAAPLLFGAEFSLPARQSRDAGFEFWRVLDRGLDQARVDHDVIIIDTTCPFLCDDQCLDGSDGVIMPLPPSARLCVSAQFWDLFSDLCNQLVRARRGTKRSNSSSVLLSRVESRMRPARWLRRWVIEGYGDRTAGRFPRLR
jgi:chromosome partitioning protein